jgi:uncharacterized protein YndB with AHSA1/START domain
MQQYQLSIKRIITAPVEKVFNAWADDKLAKQWMSPESHTVADVQIEPRQGGRFKLSMQSKKTGNFDNANSVIKEIIPNKKLVLAWKWESQAEPDGETILTLDFMPVGENQTELTLIHTELKSEKSKTDHTRGWDSCINNLEKYLINN